MDYKLEEKDLIFSLFAIFVAVALMLRIQRCAQGNADSLSTPFSAASRTIASQRRAQANSVARIASPNGITTNAGPGKTVSAIPNRSTVIPTIATTTRRAYLINMT